MNTNQQEYYKQRAGEYEKIYSKPERQKDIAASAAILQQIFSNKNVREIACGTGFWTQRIAATASSIFATDINQTVLDIAQSKNYSTKVSFAVDDIFSTTYQTKYETLFGGFIWSHIKLEELEYFIDTVSQNVFTDGTLIFMDNNFIEASNTPISRKDSNGNTYQNRLLENGETYEVVKNFPSENFIRELLGNKTKNVQFTSLQYFWILQFQLL